MNFKPGDLLFGLVDFLAFIVPGMVLLLTVPEVTSWKAPKMLDVANGEPVTALDWISFILMAYIFGHFIHHISALILNEIYERTYFRLKRKKHVRFVDSVEESVQRIIPLHLDLVRVAEAYIRCEQPSLIPELEKHKANAKLFRALSLLCLYLCFYPNVGWLGVLSLMVFSLLSFSKFANQRWRHRMLVYEFFSILNGKSNAG
jgi:hypothetical protein